MSVVAAESAIKHAMRRAAAFASNPPMSSPDSPHRERSLGNKAYRLDPSLQTHFSDPRGRRNRLRFLAPAGTGSRNGGSPWGGRTALGVQNWALPVAFGAAQTARGAPSAPSLARARRRALGLPRAPRG